jgi:hypothetical protein
MTIEAMKLALDALEFLELEIFVELDKSLNVGPTHGRKAIIALRAAIEQTKKPHRWQRLTEEEIARREQVDPIRVRIMQEAYDLADRNDSEGYNSVKVMCSEVLSMIDRLLDERQWQGLTKKEFLTAVDGLEDLEDCWVAIEAKLKEKNG